MATPETIAEQEGLQGINSDYTEKYGFHDAENYLYKAPKGLSKELVAKISEVNFDDIHYFVRASEKAERSWDDVPDDVKKTFDRLGIPEAERKFLAGVGAQYESESVYHQVNEELEKQGVVFMDMDTALKEHEDLVHEHF